MSAPERLRKVRHVLFNCECRHEQTAHEATYELEALLVREQELTNALREAR